MSHVIKCATCLQAVTWHEGPQRWRRVSREGNRSPGGRLIDDNPDVDACYVDGGYHHP